jgi:3-oxoacyl-[acyl-carrier-protein] synthase-1
MPDSEKSKIAVVAAVGMVTPVGLGAIQTAASIRAGITRISGQKIRNREFAALTMGTIPGIPARPIPPEIENTPYFTQRRGRMLHLLAHAMADCLPNPLRLPFPPPLFLALPERQSGIDRNAPPFLHVLQKLTGTIFNPGRSRAEWSGRAGGILALGEAVHEIEQENATFVLVGGVDTFVDLKALTSLDRDRRLRADRVPDSFAPGEAAGVVLLASAASAAKHGFQATARICASAKGFEPGHIGSPEPCRGAGLSSAIETFLKTTPLEETVKETFCTMNGESHWAKEWGIAQTRHQSLFDPSCALHHPAECIGDIGAAFGMVLAGLAAIGASEGYRRLPALLYGANDDGGRAVTAMTAT